jgi:hypothetical protein
MKELIAKFEERGYELAMDYGNNVAKCVRPAPRARLGYKIEFNYRFGSEARMVEYCEDFLASLDRAAAYKEQRKIERANARKEAIANVKEGDIYVASWGWEQTNVDAYQVVAKKGASVVLREIALESIEGSEGFMSDRVRPVKDAFIGGEFKKRIVGKHINVDDVRCALPAAEDKEFYRSWYA